MAIASKRPGTCFGACTAYDHAGGAQAMWSKLTMGRILGTRLVAAVALGSGLVNVFSVIGPALPARARIVRGLFPLEFISFQNISEY